MPVPVASGRAHRIPEASGKLATINARINWLDIPIRSQWNILNQNLDIAKKKPSGCNAHFYSLQTESLIYYGYTCSFRISNGMKPSIKWNMVYRKRHNLDVLQYFSGKMDYRGKRWQNAIISHWQSTWPVLRRHLPSPLKILLMNKAAFA